MRAAIAHGRPCSTVTYNIQTIDWTEYQQRDDYCQSHVCLRVFPGIFLTFVKLLTSTCASCAHP